MDGKLPEHYVAVLGSPRVGKQAIRRRFVDDQFWETQNFGPALEAPGASKTITIEGQPCVVHVWHSNGMEHTPETQERLIRGCEGVVLVYSITSRTSFDSVRALYDQVRGMRDGNQVPVYLIGSKRDLEAQRQVATMEGVVLAAKLRLGDPFFEVSARMGENVDELFYNVVREIRRSRAETGTQRLFKSIKRVFSG